MAPRFFGKPLLTPIESTHRDTAGRRAWKCCADWCCWCSQPQWSKGSGNVVVEKYWPFGQPLFDETLDPNQKVQWQFRETLANFLNSLSMSYPGKEDVIRILKYIKISIGW
jgi:hypothetical protein